MLEIVLTSGEEHSFAVYEFSDHILIGDRLVVTSCKGFPLLIVALDDIKYLRYTGE